VSLWVEEMVREKATLLEAAHDKEVEADQRASTFWGDLVDTRQEWDAVEEKVSSLATEAAVANQHREATEEQCGRLAQELTFLSIKGSELCIIVIGSPPRAPLPEGLRFVAARHTEVASQLSTLRATVSLAAQSIIGHLLIDIPQVGVVGEIVALFQEYANRCSCLKATGVGVYDLVLGPTGDRTDMAAHLEEIIG
jgi:hypothetical protein